MSEQPDEPDTDEPDTDGAASEGAGSAQDTDTQDTDTQDTDTGDHAGAAARGGADPGGRPPRGGQLAHLGHGPPPSRPPRRTGVFLDPDDLREHVGQLLRAVLGGYEVDAHGNFTFVHDDARVFVTVGPGPVGPTVGIFSVTNLDVELTPRLGGFLLTTNHTLGFGSFSYDPDNQAVWLRHTLLGTTLDGPELHAAVVAVSSTAAHFDDVIQERFGGRTFHDAPDSVREATTPPDRDDSQPPAGAGGYL